jgi:hypothetical protein
MSGAANFWNDPMRKARKVAGSDFRPGNKWAEHRGTLSRAINFGIAVLLRAEKVARGQTWPPEDIRARMNVYRDVVTNEMQEAHFKIVRMALPKPN